MIENRKEEEDKGRNEMRLDIFFLSPPSCFLFLFSLSPRLVQYSPYYEYLYRHKYNIIERGRAKFCAFTSLCNDSKITNCDIIFLIFFIQKFVFIVNNFCILLILNCNSDSSSIILSRGNCNSRQMTSLIKLFEFRSRIFSNVRTIYAVHIKYFPMLFSNNLLLLRALV